MSNGTNLNLTDAPSNVSGSGPNNEDSDTNISSSTQTGFPSSAQSSDYQKQISVGNNLTISLLPPEILLNIFRQLPPNVLLHTVPLVCRLWHQLSLTPALHKRLTFREDIPPDYAVRSIEMRPMLTCFRCPALAAANAVLPRVLPLCSSLQCLDIGFCVISDENTVLLGQLLPCTLKHLNVEGVNTIGIEFIAHMTARCKNLEALNLSHCVSVCDACVQLISTNLCCLERLNLDGIPWLSDAALDSLVTGSAFACGCFTALWLDGLELSSWGVHNFVERLATMRPSTAASGLRLLWLSFCNSFTAEAIQPIRKLTSLMSLTLRKAEQISAHDWMNLFEPPDIATSLFKDLEYLDLSETPSMNDSVLASICKCCGAQLRSLLINWCFDVTDSGLHDIVNTCHRLRQLSLVGNYQICGSPLNDVPEQMPLLQIINLTQCNQIQDSILWELAAKISGLIIFDYYGEQVGVQQNGVCHYDLWRALEKVHICSD